MAELVANCPRCGSQKITFDVTQAHIIGVEYQWQRWYEAFCICRHCLRSTIFVLSDSVHGDYQLVHTKGLLNLEGAINQYVDITDFVNLKDIAAAQPPEHLPQNVEKIFREGAKCLAIGCNNAAGTMFRLCIDIVTRGMLPTEEVEGLNARVRRDLGLRLPWMFDHGILPESIRDLSSCIKDDGNDGAHEGTLSEEDAGDMLDFTYAMLERLYTEPKRIELAKERRAVRHKKTS
ncbi:MAG: DUF4145 domain-containing protein [Sedimentisphaerales bacterium]|jgi:hypothetical protein